jgi:hypothetical protein
MDIGFSEIVSVETEHFFKTEKVLSELVRLLLQHFLFIIGKQFMHCFPFLLQRQFEHFAPCEWHLQQKSCGFELDFILK